LYNISDCYKAVFGTDIVSATEDQRFTPCFQSDSSSVRTAEILG